MKKLLLSVAVASLGGLMLCACQSEQKYTVVAPPAANPTQTPPLFVKPSAPTAGPLAPAGVGKYMDGQEKDLRARLSPLGIRVARRGDDLFVTLPNDKLFEGANLGSAGRELLASVALVLCHYDRTLLQVNAYTDTSGGVQQNLTVSQKRAALVAGALTQNGVAAARVTAQGLGQTNLRVMTGDNVSEPRNRRIELRIVAKPG